MSLPPQLRRILSHPGLLLTSLTVNLLLVTVMLMLRPTRLDNAGAMPAPAARPSTSVQAQAHAAKKLAVPDAQVAAFHWRQLDVPDFPTYVRNLRAIGCPEATIRDIIQGELKEIYTSRRQEVERQLAAAPLQSKAALEQRLQQLHAEEAAMLATSLSSGAGTAGAVAESQTSAPQASGTPGTGATATVKGAVKASINALTPAAFVVGNDPGKPASASGLSVTPTDPHLNPATAAVISQMRQDFAKSLQNANADPSSPVYLKRWNSAQFASDDQFSSLFGGDFFIKSQMDAVHAAAAAGSATTKP